MGGGGAFTYSSNAIQAFRSPEKMKRVGRGWGAVGLHFYGGIVWRPGPCDPNQSKVGPLFRPSPTSRLGLKTKAGVFATRSSRERLSLDSFLFSR